MKRSNLMFMVLVASIIFFGCSKDDSLAPLDQSDQEINLKKGKVEAEFTGRSDPTIPPAVPNEPGEIIPLPDGRTLVKGQIAEWYDEADNWRVTGKTMWHINWLMETEANTARLWGTAELFVDGDRGKWELSWTGWQTPTLDGNGNPDGGFIILVDAVGIGTEGEVKGLYAKWKYTMDPTVGFFYATKGTISVLKNGKTPFLGTSNFVAPGEPGITTVLPNGKTKVKGQTVEWYDAATDWRLTGKTLWFANWLMEKEINTAKLWGKCELIVDGEYPGDDSRGTWEISWHGYQTPIPEGGFLIKCDAVGTGKDGEVKGLVAKWTYTMDITQGFFYATEGYIVEK